MSTSCARSSESDAPETCLAHVWAVPTRTDVAPSVVGEWTQWRETEPMVPFDKAPWWVASLELAPGEYGYLIVDEGRSRIDPTQGLGGYRESDDVEVSWLIVEPCWTPRVTPSLAPGIATPSLAVNAQPARDDSPIESIEMRVDGLTIAVSEPSAQHLPLPPLTRGRHVVELVATDAAGRTSAPATQVVWTLPEAEQLDDEIVYQVMVDRFRGDGGTALQSPAHPGARAGGTLDGLRVELERGYFRSMGISSLWLSPVYVNPSDARPGRDGEHLYEGYHGYWPVDSRAVDPRIGGDSALEALVAAAHAEGIRILLDLVPNHYDHENPRAMAHQRDGWFNERDPLCICGASDCPWSTEIETCWFAPYLPDVRFQSREALATAMGDAKWWLSRFGIDGFRVDAVPMMPRVATRRIYDAARRAVGGHEGLVLLGEVFTGAGATGISALRYHLGEYGLDSAFDFPLMWAMRGFLRDELAFETVVATIRAERAALEGSNAVLARMLGNHDVPRLASALAHDDLRDPWRNPPPQLVDAAVMARIRIGFVLLLTLPGMPVLYYGDEVGLAGASDPDNRRVMPDGDHLSTEARALASDIARLGRLRRCLPTLRRGDWQPIDISPKHAAYVRQLPGDATVFVAASLTPETTTVSVPSALNARWYKDIMSNTRIELGTATQVLSIPPLGARVLIPEGHDCA